MISTQFRQPDTQLMDYRVEIVEYPVGERHAVLASPILHRFFVVWPCHDHTIFSINLKANWNKNLAANRILEEIGLSVAASAGAACHSDTVHVSHVLEAMGIEPAWVQGTVRFSTGAFTTLVQIDAAAETVIAAVGALRCQS